MRFAAVICLILSGSVLAEENYLDALWNPIHFKPAIATATDDQCLACHAEVLSNDVRKTSPAGVKSEDALAWYQTLDTFDGKQKTFHGAHLTGDYAKQVMNLSCNTCHQGNDPREESANTSADSDNTLTQRKMVDPEVCLMCHGKFPYQTMGLPGDWYQFGEAFGNNCMSCHAAIRTNRHQVNFLNPEKIEELGTKDADVCFGCHGGRSWYRIAYPYPRNAWPGIGADTPDWAKDRPTESDPRFRIQQTTSAK
jgi:nitrate/TMAO reductase-like tetraheme cytochrome c subunit